MLFASSLVLGLCASILATPFSRQAVMNCTAIDAGHLTNSNGNIFTVKTEVSEIHVKDASAGTGMSAQFQECAPNAGGFPNPPGLGPITHYGHLYVPGKEECLFVEIDIFGDVSTYHLVIGTCPTGVDNSEYSWKRVIEGEQAYIYWIGSTNSDGTTEPGCSTGAFGIADDITVPSAVDLTCTDEANVSAFFLH